MSIFFIAEIGINHNGNLDIAKQLIDMAVGCGCDAVKFQKRTIDIVYSQKVLDTPRESPWGTTTREQKYGLEFEKAEYNQIDEYCRAKGIKWFASAWDLPSQEFIAQYDLPYNKVASAMITFQPLLEMIAGEGKPTFLSTGMCSFEDIDKAVSIFQQAGCPYTLMHCVSTYPCRDDACNIKVIKALKERYNCPVGYSGHEVGILPSVLAVAMGAEAIERHITLDRAMYGSDQAASLEHRGLELLIRDCSAVGATLGDGNKRFDAPEQEVARKLRYFREQ